MLHLLLHFRAVFIHIHIFIRIAEQSTHRTFFEILRKRIADGIADWHLRVFLRIFLRLLTDVLQAHAHSFAIQPAQYHKKLIAPVTAHKLLRRYCTTQLHRKAPDILIPFIVPEIVVDPAQIVQIKYAQRRNTIFQCTALCIQKLLALVFVRQSGCLIQIDLTLQNPVLRSITHRLDQLHADQDQQTGDIHDHDPLQMVQSGCQSLGIHFRSPYCSVTDPEKFLALFDDIRLLIPLFANQ